MGYVYSPKTKNKAHQSEDPINSPKAHYRHVTLITGLCFQFWFLHPILKSLWENQTPDQNVSPLIF
jgi:hypothetical protein